MTESNNIIDKPSDKPSQMRHRDNILEIKNDNWTPEQSSFFGRLGGLKKSQAKKKAAMLRMAKERRCVSCKYLDMCRMGIAGLASVEQNHKELINEVKCKIPATLLIMTDKLYMGQYEPLYDMMWHMLTLEANDFDKKYKMLQSLERKIAQKIAVVSYSRTEEKKDIKIEVVIIDPYSKDTISEFSKSQSGYKPKETENNTIDADIIEE